MAKIIEAKAIISGEDRLSGVLDKINGKLKQVGKGAKISAEVDRLNKSLANTKRHLETVGKVQAVQDRLNSAKLGLTGAQAQADRIAAKLAAMRKGEDAAATAALVVEHKAAQKAVSQATGAVNRQTGALREAQGELAGFGVPITNIARHESALKASIEKTTAAIERETAALRRHDEAERQAATFRQQRQSAIERAALATREGGIRPTAASAKKERAGLGSGALSGAGLIGRLGDGAGLGLGIGGAVGVGLGLRKAYDSSVSFERAMIEVGKATDTAGPELEAYGDKLLKLSRDSGKTKEELASMLSSAGFAGRPKQELMDFTDYASKATVAWQTGAEETGQSLAELGNIYQANQKRIEEIGDAINTMADSSASKETDLLEFLRRAGASGKTAGIAAEQMLAFGAAMKEVGVRNETAGTAMEALLNVMKLGGEFSKKAGKGLEALGVDSDKMRRSFVTKPVETMVDLLDRLNKVADPLKRAEIMTNLFGKEYQDDMAKLMNALPQINKYLDIMKDKTQIAKGGVRLQFAQNLDKDVIKIDRATAAIDALMTRLGNPLKIQAGGIADQINAMVDKLEQGDTAAQRLVKRLTPDAGKKGDGKEPRPYEPIGDLATRLLGLIDPETAAAGAKDRKERREEALPGLKKETSDRISEMEDDIAATKRNMEKTGRSPDQIAAVLRQKHVALAAERGKRRDLEVEKASAAIPPNRPSVVDRVLSLIDAPYGNKPALPFPQTPTPIPAQAITRTVPLPPQRPIEFGGKPIPVEVLSLPNDNRIARAAGDQATLEKRATPDERLEATVWPDQITAKIDSLPPVTGSADVNVKTDVHVTMTLNEPMLNAKIEAAAGRAAAKVSLSSSGARAGAVSMPGAAATPGARGAPGG